MIDPPIQTLTATIAHPPTLYHRSMSPTPTHYTIAQCHPTHTLYHRTMSPTPTHFTIAQTSRPKLQTPPTMHASSPPHHKPTVTDSTSVASPTSCAQVSHLQHPAHKCRISNILRTSAASPSSCAQVPHLLHPAPTIARSPRPKMMAPSLPSALPLKSRALIVWLYITRSNKA